jgi:signal transduction histidine kinase
MEIILNAMQTSAKEPKVTIDSRTENAPEGNSVIIEVRDNGPGFTPEALQSALNPFYTTRTVGLGLGLSVAEKIITLHRGKLTLSNATEGKGAVVTIRLPLEAAAKEKRTAQAG